MWERMQAGHGHGQGEWELSEEKGVQVGRMLGKMQA